MSTEQKILLCLPPVMAENLNNEINRVYPNLTVLGNVPAYNLLLKAFDTYKPNVVIIHVDTPGTHDSKFQPVPLIYALDYIRKRNKRLKIILLHGQVAVTDKNEFDYKLLNINVLKTNIPEVREIGELLNLEQKHDFVHPVIANFSLKGGTGKSTFTSNFAINLKNTATPPVQFYSGYLQRQVGNLKVLIWDMDIQNGDMGVTFSVPPSKNIYELMKSEQTIDVTNIVKYIHTTEFGVDILAAPPRFDKYPEIKEEQFDALLTILKQLYHVIIFDLPTEVVHHPLSYATLKNSNIIVNIFTPDKKGIKSALVAEKIFGFLPTQPDEICYVVNKNMDDRLDIGYLKKLFGHNIDAVFPYIAGLEGYEDSNQFAIHVNKDYREQMLNLSKKLLPYFYIGDAPSNTVVKEKKNFLQRRKGK